ncbi:hypothetical protein QAD02_010433 [Eretmocerus hayati]|uniref:Uncharacterized protein n=1 Tax=Eretmocerus hayati TaxID=131215 RepID=A0ACC2NU42_9HYME|nr:hypothetical protein QAD02_010433 [Eretmocerus hayati]
MCPGISSPVTGPSKTAGKTGEDAVLSFSGRRESRKQHSLHGLGSVSGAHDQEHRQEQRREEGSSLAKRPRHPPPSTPSSGLCVSSTERSSSTSASSSCCTSSKRSRPGCDGASEVVLVDDVALDQDMGANLGKQSSKGLDGRRVQSSGNLYDHHHHCNIGRILANHTKTARQDRYKFCGSLPNHLDGQDCTDDVTIDNNNTVTDTINGNLGGTLPHKKHQNGTVLSDDSTNNPDRVKNGSDESLHGDPWKYRLEGADLARCRHAESWRKSRGSLGSCSGSVGSHSCQQHHSHSCQHTHSCHHQHQHDSWRRNSSTLCRGRAHRSAELDVNGSAGGSTLPKTSRQDSTKRSAPSLRELGDGPTRASRISIDKIDDELLLKMVRNSKSDLSKHKAQSQQAKDRDNNGAKDKDAKSAKTPSKPSHLGKCIDLKLHKLTTGGEPQDQGYASERSPEEEHAPVLPGQPFPNITPGSPATNYEISALKLLDH